jgi:hypothetical protein
LLDDVLICHSTFQVRVGAVNLQYGKTPLHKEGSVAPIE